MESRKCLTGGREPWVSPVLMLPQWKRLKAELWGQIPGLDPVLQLCSSWSKTGRPILLPVPRCHHNDDN